MLPAAILILQLGSLSPPIPQAEADLAQSLRAEQPAACPASGLAVQVLGSGGPVAEAPRAGTSYLVRVDGRPRLLIDIGSGAYLRFAEAGGNVTELDAILLTHLHADHSGDLVSVLMSGGFEDRTEPLPVIGPDAAPRFPATSDFLSGLFDPDRGPYAYLGGYLDGSEDKPLLAPRDVATDNGDGAPVTLMLGHGLTVTALPVHHGAAPALGYRVDYGGKSVVITGDQSAFSDGFETALAGSGPQLLFAHFVIPPGPGQPRALHRPPDAIGELAAKLGARRLVLTHNMNRSLARLGDGLAAIRQSYAGPVTVAYDLDCYAP
ncbi:MAG: MBL fold metallo-hydrolase [Sphingomonadales bacterium]|nr:MBL fold metallo-hydrolase [Sphingomonadales bacterium]MBD3774997.1 MBL fold metallo-hydrolase [Paracoccaceae bacterium]